nr:MAG TPA: hypothetical protein [Caudoviricetes sp.]
MIRPARSREDQRVIIMMHFFCPSRRESIVFTNHWYVLSSAVSL